MLEGIYFGFTNVVYVPVLICLSQKALASFVECPVGCQHMWAGMHFAGCHNLRQAAKKHVLYYALQCRQFHTKRRQLTHMMHANSAWSPSPTIIVVYCWLSIWHVVLLGLMS